jgi:hypothetical protein
MTRAKPRNPQPTTGTPYDSYLYPRSKTPEKQALYDLLHQMSWRFDANHSNWHTPETEAPGSGRLEWALDFTWARIQPPNKPGSDVRREPILKLRRVDDEWRVE